MTTEFAPLILEFKRGSVTDAGQFEGYCSTFGPPADSVDDIVEHGAFTESLREHKAGGTVPGLLWSHNVSEPIGRWLSFVEDSKGLLGRGKLTLETRRGREALALLKDEACSLSIGFAIPSGGAVVKSGVRHINKARLIEISIVAIPANLRARITSVKSRPANPRELEHLLRDVAGFSARESKRLTAGGWRGLARDERADFDLILEKIDILQRSIDERKSL